MLESVGESWWELVRELVSGRDLEPEEEGEEDITNERRRKRKRREKAGEEVGGGGKSWARPLFSAAQEKTRALLVIASSAPVFKAHRDKRAAIYWSPHIMATFIYSSPFRRCQGLSAVWAKNRNPRCFTNRRVPSSWPSLCELFTDIHLPNICQTKMPFNKAQHVGTFICDLL